MPSLCGGTGRVGAYRTYVLLLCLIAYLLNQLDRYLLPILSRPIAQELHYGDQSCLTLTNATQSSGNATCEHITNSTECVSKADCHWTYNGQGFEYQIIVGPVFIVIYTFCGIFIGYMAYYFRRKNLLAFFLIFWSVATILAGLVKEYWQMALLRFALGIGEAGCTPFATSLLADMFDADSRATAVAVYNFGIYVGYSMSYALGNFIFKANIMNMGWRWAYFISGIPGVLVGTLIFATVRETPPPAVHKKTDETTSLMTNSVSTSGERSNAPASKIQELKAIARMFLSPSLLMLCVAGSIRNSAGYVWAANTQPYFELNGQTPQQIGSYMSWIPLVGGSLGVLFGGFISDRLVKRRGLVARVAVLAVSQICAAPFALLALLLPSPWCYISLIPSNVIGEMWVGVCLTVITELVESRMRTMAVAYYLFIISNVGGNLPLLVPVFQSMFQQQASLSPPLALRYSLVVLFPGLYAISSLLFVLTICVMKWQLLRNKRAGYTPLPFTKDEE